MSVTLGPRLGLMLNAAAGDAHPNEFRDFLRGMDALCQISAKSRTTAAQPSSPTNGDTYLLPASATGTAWGGKAAGTIAYYTTQQTITSGGTESTVSGWDFFTPKRGYIANVEDESDSFYKWTGSTWALSNVDDTLLAHLAGAETFTGLKTFSAGINLGGAANLSAYDEGTWTPTAVNLGGTVTAYSTKWTRIGATVFFTITITGTGLSSAAASTYIIAPFTPARFSIGSADNGAMIGGPAKTHTVGFIYLPTIPSTTQINVTGTIFLT